jgi:hypothetical protein
MLNAKYFSLCKWSTLPLLAFLFLVFIISCEEKMEEPDSPMAVAEKLTCEGCHTDRETLEELAPGIDEPPPSSGGG